MWKQRLVLALIACACVALILHSGYRGELARRYALRMLCWNIAQDLVTNTNSERVFVIDHWSSTNFSAFLATQAKFEAAKLGDKPTDFIRDLLDRQAHAAARLYFSNQNNKHFEIRIRGVNSTTNYTVIGAGWD